MKCFHFLLLFKKVFLAPFAPRFPLLLTAGFRSHWAQGQQQKLDVNMLVTILSTPTFRLPLLQQSKEKKIIR